ncbi:flagellar assembly protein FliH [Methylophilus rhizosphaerae]|uniref:Flagellar assembly protein FliH n=1 Tax=Methylophilus rhizosphaerae TaxID=492660 RepID=A0A1G8ZCJ3_9PROT|nr:FliH/SctL family protein [Methylophilus rhizosphaerae]SDK12747.1 flagellar assembly protein FliH [Methylophilus rhizosphaerae]
MVASATPKEKMTAYERWELASFDEVSDTERVRREKAQAEENARTVSHILKQVRQEAYEEGFKTGYQDGLVQGQTRIEAESAQLLQLSASFQQALSMQDVAVAESILTLALELSKAMLKSKLQADSEAIIPVVLDAMQYLPHIKQPARVIVHHEDAKVLRANIGEQLKEQGWQLVEDSQVERGGCLVETADNQIDASNEIRWKRLVQGLSHYDDWHKPVSSAE